MGSSESNPPPEQGQPSSPLLHSDPTQAAAALSPQMVQATEAILKWVKNHKVEEVKEVLRGLKFDLPVLTPPPPTADEKYQMEGVSQADVAFYDEAVPSQQSEFDGEVSQLSSSKAGREFKESVRLLLYLVQFFEEGSKEHGIDPGSHRGYTQILLEYLKSLTIEKEVSYGQRWLLVEVLAERIRQSKEGEMAEEADSTSIFEQLVKCCQNHSTLDRLMALLDEVYLVGGFTREVVRVHHRHLVQSPHSPENQGLKAFLHELSRKPWQKLLLSAGGQREYFSTPRNCKFYFKYEIRQEQAFEEIRRYLETWLGLLELPTTSEQVVAGIVEQSSVERVFGFEQYFLNSVEEDDAIFQVVSKANQLSLKLVGLLAGTNNLPLLKKVIQESYQSVIGRKATTFNFTLERLFALAVLGYFQDIPTCQQLEEVIGQEMGERKVELLMQHLTFRDIFERECEQMAQVEGPHVNALKDHLYLSILVSALAPAQVPALFKEYVCRHMKEAHASAVRMVDQQAPAGEFDSQARQEVTKAIKRTSTLLKVLLSAVETPLAVMVLRSRMMQQPAEVEAVLADCLAMYEGMAAIEFKNVSEKLVGSEQVVRSFIKDHVSIKSKRVYPIASHTQHRIYLSPGSELLRNELAPEIAERVVSIKNSQASPSELSQKIANEEALLGVLDVIEYCVSRVAQSGQEGSLKTEVEGLLGAVILLAHQNRSGRVAGLLKQLEKLVGSPSALCGKALQRLMGEKEAEKEAKGDGRAAEKKRLKMEALKSKQKGVLENYKEEEGKSFLEKLECIICKNSKEGSPFLLGHFRYNNLYSRTVLPHGRPFLEFTTCGHAIHEECLKEVHNGDFRIWYPCILCKSVTNILLPVMSPSLPDHQKLERIIAFLKTLGGTYTFLYGESPKLVEFSLEDVNGVFRLLFKSLIYEIALYPIINLHYFENSQFPIIQFIYHLAAFTRRKLPHVDFEEEQEIAFDAKTPFTQLYQYVRAQLLNHLMDTEEFVVWPKDLDKELKAMVDRTLSQLERHVMEPKLGELTCAPKYKALIEEQLARPCLDLWELQGRQVKCGGCSKVIRDYSLCVLCGWTGCFECGDVQKVHASEEHLGDAIFVSSDRGQTTYVHDQLSEDSGYLYANYIGEELSQPVKAKKGEYSLNPQAWNKVLNDIFMNRMHKELVKNMD